MWVRRALQRAEPEAQQDFKGEPRAGLLAAGFSRLLINNRPSQGWRGRLFLFISI